MRTGITITGHDPAYSQDAVNLARAFDRLEELAAEESPTDIRQVKELHTLILGDKRGAGDFRREPVKIAGSPHTPPSWWAQIVSEMEYWENWSRDNASAPALLRAIVLHTWLTHIHPFSDGNGRTSRAVLNLELIRSGLPVVIIRKKDRLRYYEALAESDEGGDLRLIAELVLARAADALNGLERAASTHQGYDIIQQKIRHATEQRVAIWNDAVRLLFSLVDEALTGAFGDRGSVRTRWYDAELGFDDYVALTQNDSAGNSWLFRFDAEVPGVWARRYLAWVGYRSYAVQQWHGIGPGPSVFWSIPDDSGYRKWIRDDSKSPGIAEFSLELPNVDKWIARLPGGSITRLPPSAIAERVVGAVASSIGA